MTTPGGEPQGRRAGSGANPQGAESAISARRHPGSSFGARPYCNTDNFTYSPSYIIIITPPRSLRIHHNGGISGKKYSSKCIVCFCDVLMRDGCDF